MSKKYQRSDEHQKLQAMQTYARYLLSRLDDSQEMPLEVAIPMYLHIEQLMRQLGSLKTGIGQAIEADLRMEDIKRIETDEFEVSLDTTTTRGKIEHQSIASEVVSRMQEQAVRRNKQLDERKVRSIVLNTFWSLVELGTPKWSVTKLKREGIDINDHIVGGEQQTKLQVRKKG